METGRTMLRLLLIFSCFVLLLFKPLAAFPYDIAQLQTETAGDLLLFFEEEELFTATGTPKTVRTAPSVATVITAEEIKNIGARTINEALETVPGLHVGVSTKNATSQVYSIRGIHTSVNPQVLLLMNGVPISYLFSGTRAFFNMPVSSVSRIEVIRGPGSAVYGADAFAGIINIITKDAGDVDGTIAGARTGSFDTNDAFIQHGGTYKGWDIFAGLEYQTSNGDSSRVVDSDQQSSLDAILGTNASAAPGALESGYESLDLHLGLARENWNLRLWGAIQDNDNYDGVTNVVSRGGDLDINQYLADLTYENDELIRDLTLTGRFYYMYYKNKTLVQLFPEGAELPIDLDGNINKDAPAILTSFPDGVWGEPVQIDKQTGTELTGLYSGFERHRVRSAIGYKHLREEYESLQNFGPGVLDGSQLIQDGTLTDVTGTGNIFAPDKTREIFYLSLQDEWDFARDWELVAGIRYDNYSDFGNTFNPRIALVWQTRDDLTTKILYGTAFRPPSFTELYARNNPSNNGNEDLDPETIQTVEFVADYKPLSTLNLRMNLFYYEIKDLIELVQDPGQTTQTSQNSKDQKGQGFELEAMWLPVNNLVLKGNLAHQRSENSNTGEPIPDAPRWQAYMNAHWSFMPKWSLDAQYFWIAERKRAAGDLRGEVKDNDIVNMTLRRTNISRHWEAALAVRNIFDENVLEPGNTSIPGDYPMEERSFWAEVRFHM